MLGINWRSPVTKTLLALLSLLFWTVLSKSFTFALVLMTCLLVHEYGHMWALKRCGISFEGPYVTPFGAALVPTSRIPNLKNEFFFAVMGPVAGTLLLLITASAYILTKHEIFYLASWLGAFINFFNLFPIHPLDGGRVAKAITFSLNPTLGAALMIVGMITVLLFAIKTGLLIFFLILLLGAVENTQFLKHYRFILEFLCPPMNQKEAYWALAAYLALGLVLFSLLYLFDPNMEFLKRLIGL